MKPTIHRCWGVQYDFGPVSGKPNWHTLGTGWIKTNFDVPRHMDFWPANFRTRREAKQAVNVLTARAQTEAQHHSKGSRFRVVRLRIMVQEIEPCR